MSKHKHSREFYLAQAMLLGRMYDEVAHSFFNEFGGSKDEDLCADTLEPLPWKVINERHLNNVNARLGKSEGNTK